MEFREKIHHLKKDMCGGGLVWSPAYSVYTIMRKDEKLPLRLLNKELAEDLVILLDAAHYSGIHDKEFQQWSNETNPYGLILYSGKEDNQYAYSITYDDDVIRNIKPMKLHILNNIINLLNETYLKAVKDPSFKDETITPTI